MRAKQTVVSSCPILSDFHAKLGSKILTGDTVSTNKTGFGVLLTANLHKCNHFIGNDLSDSIDARMPFYINPLMHKGLFRVECGRAGGAG